ncbi:MAG: ketoacyl-ACP synthase III [Planctomycetes bacterium]|nr:ketoacyl-ACP synthase III [Planctomycetota bacterium]
MESFIEEIAYALPETIVTNEDLRRDNPDWDVSRLEKRTGVRRRCIAAPRQTALDLGLEACEKLFEARPEAREQIDAIIFCTETADYVLPPNACVLHGKLALPESVLSFDVDLGCSGYPYCLGLAKGMLSTRMATNALLVNADTYSKLIHKNDQSTRALFGDAAAASWIAASKDGGGILDVECCTAGQLYEKFIVPGGGYRQPRSDESSDAEHQAAAPAKPLDTIHMDGMGILAFVNAKIPGHVKTLLARNGLGIEDVDLFVFHQASRMVLDTLPRLMKIRPEQMHSNLAEVGNTVSASIPIVLRSAVDAGRLARGDTVLVCGFGLGLSWGSALLEW